MATPLSSAALNQLTCGGAPWWDNYPEGWNLYNAAGLPAAPFRTDNW